MKEILLTSSVLILALLALRRLFRRTISRRMQYALWALVLVRLLIPGSLGSMAHNVLTVTEPVQTAVAERLEDSALYLPTAREPLSMRPGAPDLAPELAFPDGASSAWVIENDETAVQYRRISTAEVLTYVWYAGMLAVGAWFLFTNLRFSRALRRARTPYPVDNCRYPVYLVPELASPCLVGLFRPAVYLNDTAASPEALRFVLAHEQTHARHLDPLWSLLRGVCLTVYWFDPLVWIAAMLSREDCELACDEGTLHVLGETERIAYGKTLLSLVPVRDKPQNPLLGATTMTSGKKSLKERIARIAENRQAKAAAVFAVLALTILVCAVSFTGATKTYTVTQEWYDAGFSEEDAQACLAFLDWAEDFDVDDANAASWLAESGAADFKALDGKPTEMAAAFAQAVKSIRAEELSPPTDSSNEVTYTLSIADRRKGFCFSLNEDWQVALIAPAEYEADGEPFTYGKPVAVINNAALTQFLRGMFHRNEEDSVIDALLADAELYIPENNKEPDTVSVRTMGNVLCDETMPDGTRVVCYWDSTEHVKYWALRQGDMLLRFCREENEYDSDYAAEPFINVLGEKGFRILAPRGAAYYAYDYYVIDSAGVPRLLAACANHVEEIAMGDEVGLRWFYHGGQDIVTYFRHNGKLYLFNGYTPTFATDLFLMPEIAAAIELQEDGASIGSFLVAHAWNTPQLQNFTYVPCAAPERENGATLTLWFANNDASRFVFYEGTNTLGYFRGGADPGQYYESRGDFSIVDHDGRTLYDVMLAWYDEAEFGTRQSEVEATAVPNHGQTWQEAAQEWLDAYEGVHLNVRSGSHFKFTWMKNRIRPADDTTEMMRERHELGENGHCFYSTTEFVAETQSALNEAMAGNTGGCDDPDAPEGAFEYGRCCSISLEDDGWHGRMHGTGW